VVHVSVGRRTFVVAGGALAVGAGTYAWLRRLGYDVDPSLASPRASRSKAGALANDAFDAPALPTLAALADLLIPGDPARKLPSAADAGVVDYLLSAARAPGLLPVRNEILKLCRLLDRLAAPARFAELDPEAQQRAIGEVLEGRHDRGAFEGGRAVEATLRLALEGYLGHPDHGGNRSAVAWDAFAIGMPRATAHH
jgi:hypothetical protein